MKSNVARMPSLRDLRKFVNETLCQLSDFEPGAFRFTERLLVRGERPCGMIYCVHGPRNCKLTAIWETERNQVLFYGSAGERLGRTVIGEAPSLKSESGASPASRPRLAAMGRPRLAAMA